MKAIIKDDGDDKSDWDVPLNSKHDMIILVIICFNSKRTCYQRSNCQLETKRRISSKAPIDRYDHRN